MANGAADEPAETAGATVLAARALSEGTERYDAIGLVEASERLGASLHAEAGWDALSAGVEVPAERLPAGARAPGRAGPPPDVPRAPRSSACATSASTISSRRRPTRADAPRRRTSRRSTRRTRRITGRPAGRARPSKRLDPRPAPGGLRARPRSRPVDAHRGRSDRRHRRPRRRRAPVRGWAAASGSSPVGRIDDRGTGGRTHRPGHPSAGRGPDRDPGGPPGPASADPGLPCRLGHERDPRRPVQLAAEHAAPRGEGLHLRGRRRLRHAPRRRSVRRPCRGQHRGDGPGGRRDAGRAASGCATSR